MKKEQRRLNVDVENELCMFCGGKGWYIDEDGPDERGGLNQWIQKCSCKIFEEISESEM